MAILIFDNCQRTTTQENKPVVPDSLRRRPELFVHVMRIDFFPILGYNYYCSMHDRCFDHDPCRYTPGFIEGERTKRI
jgi:hypothetical protein